MRLPAVGVEVLVLDGSRKAEVPPEPTQMYPGDPKISASMGVVAGRSTIEAHTGSCSSCREAEEEP